MALTPMYSWQNDWAEPYWAWLVKVGDHYEDPRTKDWQLMDIRYPLTITAAYLLGIAVGNRCMQHRPAFRIRAAATVHNFILFTLSLYMCIETLRQELYLPCDTARSLLCSWRAIGSCLVGALCFESISFLHVYHHATTFFPVWWSVIKYGPGGAAYFCCALNSFIHVGMYGYYLLAGLGIKLAALKPFITYSQMIQFLCFISQALYMLITDCYQPRLTVVFLLFQCIVFFALFSNFAYKNYWKPKQKIA